MKTRVALRVTACPCDVRFTPKADICSAQAHVCFVPEADMNESELNEGAR